MIAWERLEIAAPFNTFFAGTDEDLASVHIVGGEGHGAALYDAARGRFVNKDKHSEGLGDAALFAFARAESSPQQRHQRDLQPQEEELAGEEQEAAKEMQALALQQQAQEAVHGQGAGASPALEESPPQGSRARGVSEARAVPKSQSPPGTKSIKLDATAVQVLRPSEDDDGEQAEPQQREPGQEEPVAGEPAAPPSHPGMLSVAASSLMHGIGGMLSQHSLGPRFEFLGSTTVDPETGKKLDPGTVHSVEHL